MCNRKDAISSADASRQAGTADGSGLVLLETSVHGIEIDRVQARLDRMQAAVRTAVRLINDEVSMLPGQYKTYMLTLTYRPGVEWEPYHITNCIHRYRQWAAKHDVVLRYVWVSEIQANRYANGALLGECVHYHLLLWLPARLSPPKPDKSGYWPYGLSQRVIARKPINYLTKYATKGYDVVFPKGLRTHGSGGLSSEGRNQRTWWMMPRWVRVLFDASEKPRRKPGGGIIARATGVVVESIWSVLVDSGRVFCWLRDDVYEILSTWQIYRLIDAGILPPNSLFDLDAVIDAAWNGCGNSEGF